jgi:hypothetical protein
MKYPFTLFLFFMFFSCSGNNQKSSDTLVTDFQEKAEPDTFSEPENEIPPSEIPSSESSELIAEVSEEIPLPDLFIKKVEPDTGMSSGGETVVITGGGFEKGIKVFFNQSPALDVYLVDSTKINAVTPPMPPQVVNIFISRPDGQNAVLENAFTYKNNITVVSVVPSEIPVEGGIPVTIKGTGFLKDSKVLIGKSEAIQVKNTSDDTILCLAPPNTEGFKTVFINNSTGSASLKNAVFYYNLPEIFSVIPMSGGIDGGMKITISGKGFYDGTTIYFGTKLSGDTFIKSTGSLETIVPSHPEGFVNVSAYSKFGSDILLNGFYYADSGTVKDKVFIKSLKPVTGSVEGGTDVQIIAEGIVSFETTKVFFGQNKANVISVDPANLLIICKTSEGKLGKVTVTVISPNGEDQLADGFEYIEELAVKSVEPSSGPKQGGTAITIHGSGFKEGTTVKIGALPAKNVIVNGSTTITAETPSGPAGKVPVMVQYGDETALLDDGFEYESEGELLFVDPSLGSTKGGTLVKIFGAGFTSVPEIYFDNLEATHIDVLSSTLITAKTPPHEIGTVDVKMIVEGETYILPKAFTYFDPVSYFGGTWGGEIEGTVNVSVFDAMSGEPVADAYIILWIDPKTPYQGYTGTDGMITFSGIDLNGYQMVSASKECYENNSVVKYNATNITLYLVWNCPSMGMPPSVSPGKVSGKVIGLDKYILAPPGNCWDKGTAPDGILCKWCWQDSECGAPPYHCTQIEQTGKFCTKDCKTAEDCPDGYMCTGLTGSSVQCVPAPGNKVARCETTKESIFSENPAPGSGAVADENHNYSLTTRLGEIAVVCQGGIEDENLNIFTPYAMGVKRHLFVAPGDKINNVDITLDIPLDRHFKVRLDDPPSGNPGPSFNYLFLYLDFGADGILESKEQVFSFGDESFEIKNQPKEFTGDIYDVSFILMGGAFSSTADNTPFSVALHQGITDVQDDILYSKDQDKPWIAKHCGVKNDINSIFGSSINSAFAVGTQGSIYFFNGFSFTQQQILDINSDLYGIWGSADDDVWVVGAQGTILHFDGTTWSIAEKGKLGELKSVYGTGKNNVYAAGWYAMAHYDGNTWSSVPGAPLQDYRSIFAADMKNVFAVGGSGYIVQFNGSAWLNHSSGTTSNLNGIFGFAPDDIYAVGDSGTILHYDGMNWTEMKSGTAVNLNAVYGTSKDSLYSAGSNGTILHMLQDGSWENLSIKGVYTNLRAIFGFQDSFISMGRSEYLMSPLLQVPEITYPPDQGYLEEGKISFKAKHGIPPSFNYIMIAIPGAFGDTPIWSILTKGDVGEVLLPDFEKIQGNPYIPQGTALKLTVIRAYREGFDINNYDFNDLYTLNWLAWSADIIMFQR